MADSKDTKQDKRPDEVGEAPNAVSAGTAEEAARERTGAPEVPVAVGSDAVFENPEPEDLETYVEDEPVKLKQAEPIVPVTEAPVFEVHVQTDKRVDYVIVPPEGRGDATLPLHAFLDAKTPEQQLSDDS